MDYYYNLRIQFRGTNYQGWQIQPNVPTVQGELNNALSRVFKSPNVYSTGSGRTDAGVHALDYLVKIKVPFFIELGSLVSAINANLNSDIRVLLAELSTADFLPTNHAKSKEYLYRFSNLPAENAFQAELIPNISFDLDIAKMEKACSFFIGEHDFSDFQCTGSDVKTTVRKIFECDLTYYSQNSLAGMFPPYYQFRVVGNGFLKQMVRLMVGTLWHVGRGRITLDSLRCALQSPTGNKLGIVAPACGLVKSKVTY